MGDNNKGEYFEKRKLHRSEHYIIFDARSCTHNERSFGNFACERSNCQVLRLGLLLRQQKSIIWEHFKLTSDFLSDMT